MSQGNRLMKTLVNQRLKFLEISWIVRSFWVLDLRSCSLQSLLSWLSRELRLESSEVDYRTSTTVLAECMAKAPSQCPIQTIASLHGQVLPNQPTRHKKHRELVKCSGLQIREVGNRQLSALDQAHRLVGLYKIQICLTDIRGYPLKNCMEIWVLLSIEEGIIQRCHSIQTHYSQMFENWKPRSTIINYDF